jgi:hypothetical protein
VQVDVAVRDATSLAAPAAITEATTDALGAGVRQVAVGPRGGLGSAIRLSS